MLCAYTVCVHAADMPGKAGSVLGETLEELTLCENTYDTVREEMSI